MNVVTISGHLGDDVDVRFKQGGEAEGEFSVAVNDYIGKDEANQPKYWTTWVQCKVTGKRALALQDELYRGRLVTVSGQLRTSRYKISDDRYVNVTFILVDDVVYDPKVVRSANRPAEQTPHKDQ
jgi:single stranded DNA-binding protein